LVGLDDRVGANLVHVIQEDPAIQSVERDTAGAMSQENVEVVRRGFEHFEATGEFPPETVDPEFV
jgi:hypothetical protein